MKQIYGIEIRKRNLTGIDRIKNILPTPVKIKSIRPDLRDNFEAPSVQSGIAVSLPNLNGLG